MSSAKQPDQAPSSQRSDRPIEIVAKGAQFDMSSVMSDKVRPDPEKSRVPERHQDLGR